MATFGFVVLAQLGIGRDPLFPNADYDILHVKMTVNNGVQLPDFITINPLMLGSTFFN